MLLSQGQVPTSLPKEKDFLLLFCPLLRAFQGETSSDSLCFGVPPGRSKECREGLTTSLPQPKTQGHFGRCYQAPPLPPNLTHTVPRGLQKISWTILIIFIFPLPQHAGADPPEYDWAEGEKLRTSRTWERHAREMAHPNPHGASSFRMIWFSAFPSMWVIHHNTALDGYSSPSLYSTSNIELKCSFSHSIGTGKHSSTGKRGQGPLPGVYKKASGSSCLFGEI